MENSGKYNPESGFKSPRAEMPTFKWLFLKNLRSIAEMLLERRSAHSYSPAIPRRDEHLFPATERLIRRTRKGEYHGNHRENQERESAVA